MDKPLDCGRCDKDTCPDCQEIKSRIEFLQKHICSNNCKCLCVLERPINQLADVNIIDSDFKTQCGSIVYRKIIEQLKKIETDRVKERIAYKTMEDRQNNKITKLEKEVTALKLNINAIVSGLAFKGINLKI